MFTVGVDIGGTNTDMVLLNSQKNIVKKVKQITTNPIDKGFAQALKTLIEGVDPTHVEAVFVGTTHAINALLERKDLYRVGLIRIAGHHPQTIPPAFRWPDELKCALSLSCITIGGGFDCDGSSITPFSLSEAKQAIETLVSQGAESLAVVGVFAPLYPEQELAICSLYPNLPFSLSHQIGGIGIIERENSTILNAALKKPLSNGFQQLRKQLDVLSIQAPLFLTQNNGTILPLEQALEYPILTLSAGPTNSFIGGAQLSDLHDAIIVDIGGTSTDVGIVRKGFPRRSVECTQIGGVSLNFPMPDVLSVAIGGGSYVSLDPQQIGPKSAAKNITQEALCFGGHLLTLTDLAVALNPEIIPGTLPVDCPQSHAILAMGINKIERLVEKIGGKEQHLPVIVVGGGAILFRSLLPSSRYQFPENGTVANAFGAALSEISATIDVVVSLENREKTMDELMAEAIKQAISRGADPKTTRIVYIETIPYHYIPNHLARVMITAAGTQMRRLLTNQQCR